MDDLAVAFAMRCDEKGLTYEAGVRAAAGLADEIEQAAEDRSVERTPWHESLDRAAEALCGWLRESVSEAVCQELDELHPDTWRAVAEVAIRAGRWEEDTRPFTTHPELAEGERREWTADAR